MKKSIKGWIKKWKVSKSSQKFCRIHFCTGSTHFYSVYLHFYTVCLQQILVNCCIRHSWGDGKECVPNFRKVTIASGFGYKVIAYERCYPKKTTPNPIHCVETQAPTPAMLLRPIHHFQQPELSSFTGSCIAVGRGYLCNSYTKTAHQQTGKNPLILLSTEYQFAEL